MLTSSGWRRQCLMTCCLWLRLSTQSCAVLQVAGLTDSTLASLQAASQLTCLRLSSTRAAPCAISDQGLQFLAALKQLRSLEAHHLPDVTPQGWQQLASLSSVSQLTLSWNGADSLQLLLHLGLLPLEQVRFVVLTSWLRSRRCSCTESCCFALLACSA